MAEIMKNDNVEPNNFSENCTIKKPLIKELGDAAEGLIYYSETDAPVLPFEGGKTAIVSKEVILSLTGNTSDSTIEEKDFSEFFDRLTIIQDWFSKERAAAAQKFAVLRNLMEGNLWDLKVFKIGCVSIEIYAVGIDRDSNLTGIKTRAVET